MKKSILSSLIIILCCNQLIGQEEKLRNFVLINGKEYKVHFEKTIKNIAGLDYAIIDGQEYLLQQRELYQQGPIGYEFFITKENGEEYSITDDYHKEIKTRAKKNGKHIIQFQRHPPSKPFIRWTSPKTGELYKWYDVLRTPGGRIIPREEFNSYKGNFTWGKRIKGGPDAMDTTIIKPPTDLMLKKEADRKVKFKAQVGKSIPQIEFQDINGKSYTSQGLLGKVVVLNFWFTSCPPCVKEMPELNQLVDKYKRNKDVVFIAFATDSKTRIDKFLTKRQFDYQIVSDAQPIAEGDFNVLYYPSHFIIDKKGVIRYAREDYDETLITELEQTIIQSLK